ncbi:hypothetical protein PFWH6_0601 [Pseudomonas fluorescens WH6]|nr:hypothetical protein PFWH6_0601 [Pseudomonas fluorescens WH6]
MQYAYPLLAIFIWAGNTVVNKLAVGSIFPSEIGFIAGCWQHCCSRHSCSSR